MLMEGHCHKDTSLIPFRTAAVSKDLCICYRLENFLHGDSGIFLTLLKSFTNIVDYERSSSTGQDLVASYSIFC